LPDLLKSGGGNSEQNICPRRANKLVSPYVENRQKHISSKMLSVQRRRGGKEEIINTALDYIKKVLQLKVMDLILYLVQFSFYKNLLVMPQFLRVLRRS
jgi:protoporphyrinogen oxidase